jgi:hypothetical protein
MISANGNGTVGVRFFVDGVADYVTVNKELPVMTDGTVWNNESVLKFANGPDGGPLWAELVEKAFAELNAEPDAVHGASGEATNAYAGISGGEAPNALAEITGQSSVTYNSDRLVADAATIGAAFKSGEEVELDTNSLPNGYHGNLVGDHVFEVVGYDESTDEFTLHNPWGSACESPKSPMTFSMTAQALAAAGCEMYVAEGSAAAEHAAVHPEVEAAIANAVGASHGPVGHFML